MSIAVTSTGAFRRFETTVLLSVEDMVEAMARASEFGYVKPGT